MSHDTVNSIAPRHGMVTYDALHAWCREGKDEVHTWNPQAKAALAADPA